MNAKQPRHLRSAFLKRWMLSGIGLLAVVLSSSGGTGDVVFVADRYKNRMREVFVQDMALHRFPRDCGVREMQKAWGITDGQMRECLISLINEELTSQSTEACTQWVADSAARGLGFYSDDSAIGFLRSLVVSTNSYKGSEFRNAALASLVVATDYATDGLVDDILSGDGLYEGVDRGTIYRTLMFGYETGDTKRKKRLIEFLLIRVEKEKDIWFIGPIDTFLVEYAKGYAQSDSRLRNLQARSGQVRKIMGGGEDNPIERALKDAEGRQ